MSTAPTDGDPAFADLLDELLDALLNGEEPDLQAVAARHAAVAHRAEEAWQLACGVAGRRETRQPSLRGYRILRELGRGGMGTVYLARQEQLDREVALKVLPHSFGLSAHSRQRFLEEAKALARVHHEHIVGIHRIVDDGDLLAFEMEYIDGPSLQMVLTHLRQVKERDGRAPSLEHVAELLQLPTAALGANNLTQFFVRVARQIGGALGAVHHAGFVHRDVKPANVLLRRNGLPVLADFGLVRDTELERTHKTGFAGTPVYSSPEQLRGNAPIGPATDVYALAVTLYECLTLATPFAGRTTTDMLHRIESGRVPPLRRHAPHVPRDLGTIVAHAMELEPERRYQDGQAFADDLQRLLELQPILARPPGMLRRTAKFLRRHSRPLLAGCLGAVLVAAFLLPLLNQAQAAERDLAAAREHVRTARQALLAPECRSAAWQPRQGTGKPGEVALEESAMATLQRAAAEYGEALALLPDAVSTQRELAVVRMLIWLRQLAVVHADSLNEAMARPEYQTIAAALPPAVRAFAEATAAGRTHEQDADVVLQACSDADRHSLGLLAFLVGELRWCELAWTNITATPEDQALRDAGLGLLYLNEGAPERAYVRLQAAQRELPAAMLALELADAAITMGETELARKWLAEVPTTTARQAARRRIQADLLVATGDEASAARLYTQLAAQNPLDPTAPHRLAQLAIREGDLEEAAVALDALLLQWPDLAALHLDRARVALQQRDVAAYLHEVLATLRPDPRARTSIGASADRLEILRLGGLLALHRQASRAGNDLRCGRTFLGGEMPLRALLRSSTVDELEALLPSIAELQAGTRGFLANGAALNDTAALLLITAPFAMSRLPALANHLTPLQRVFCEALPWGIHRVYPRLHANLRTLFISLLPTSWQLVTLMRVPAPLDLHATHVFGSALARGADWNGDGCAEMLVGCEAADPRAAPGRVYSLDGRSTEVRAVITARDQTHLFGHALALVGDLDGDGVADWLVGAPAGTREAQRGYVDLYSGRNQHRLAHIEGEGAAFGVDVCGLGDCDGDGIADFAVATPPIVLNTTGQGRATIYSGRTREPLHEFQNAVAGVWFGACLANVGDADGDGVPDLVVAGNFGNAPGLACLYSGRTGRLLHSWRDETTASGYGMAVAGPGDLDGDGYGDVTVSAIRLDDRSGVDQVHVYSGRTGARIASLAGSRPGSRLGISLARFDQDRGRGPLLAIGASLGGAGTCGTVELWSPTSGSTTSVQGPTPFSAFGGIVVPTADLDGDGRSELYVAGPLDRGAGAVYRIDTTTIPFVR
ncbi:MAG: protein kinase [Planctomycetes bacterium]|nr:protein kinase [Planctomycetota bacterium]